MKRGLLRNKIKFIFLVCAVIAFALAVPVMASAAQARLVKKSYRGKSGYYYCVNGKVQTSFTGLFKYKGRKWMVKKGKVQTSFTGLFRYKGQQWLIRKGRAATKFTGIYKYRKKKYLIRRGKVDKNYSGKYKYKGKTYTIRKGRVVKTASPSKTASTKSSSAKGSSSSYSPVREGYYYSQLSSKLKKVYNDFYNQALKGKTLATKVAGVSQDEVDRVYNCMYYDHPEIFWLSSKVSKKSRSSMKKKIEAAADKIIASIPSGASDYQKVKYIYEYIINNTEYVSGSEGNQDIQSVLLSHKSVCAGYARSFQYLMNRMGIFCITVCGRCIDKSHAWNIVRIDGNYYYVDTTFGDKNVDRIDYSFLCYSDSDLKKLGGKSEAPADLPACTSERYNYYRLNHVYFKTYDKEKVKKVILKAARSGKKLCELRFGSAEECNKAVADLLSDGVLLEGGYYSYTTDSYLDTLIFVR